MRRFSTSTHDTRHSEHGLSWAAADSHPLTPRKAVGSTRRVHTIAFPERSSRTRAHKLAYLEHLWDASAVARRKLTGRVRVRPDVRLPAPVRDAQEALDDDSPDRQCVHPQLL